MSGACVGALAVPSQADLRCARSRAVDAARAVDAFDATSTTLTVGVDGGLTGSGIAACCISDLRRDDALTIASAVGQRRGTSNVPADLACGDGGRPSVHDHRVAVGARPARERGALDVVGDVGAVLPRWAHEAAVTAVTDVWQDRHRTVPARGYHDSVLAPGNAAARRPERVGSTLRHRRTARGERQRLGQRRAASRSIGGSVGRGAAKRLIAAEGDGGNRGESENNDNVAHHLRAYADGPGRVTPNSGAS